LLRLFCDDGNCRLSTLSLQSCADTSFGKKARTLSYVWASTAEGNLKVRNEGHTLIVQENGTDMGGDYVTTLRLDYEPVGAGGIVSRLKSFSGGFVKNSNILKKTITEQFIALPNPYQVVEMGCGIMLPGIDR
jgi:hypothetical protein